MIRPFGAVTGKERKVDPQMTPISAKAGGWFFNLRPSAKSADDSFLL